MSRPKRTSLAQARRGKPEPAPEPEPQQQAETQTPVAAPEPDAPKKRDVKKMSLYIDTATWRALNSLALELSDENSVVRTQDLMRLGVDLVFQKYGRSRIAGSPERLLDD